MSFEEIMHCLSEADQKIIRDIKLLMEAIDRQTQKFADETGLKCKEGCGGCCDRRESSAREGDRRESSAREGDRRESSAREGENSEIETTATEFLPLAVYLWSMGLGEDTLQRTRSNPSKAVCVFYKPDPMIKGHGHCGIYDYRPGICRLFGFSARRDKYGKSDLVTCKVIKESQPKACKRTQTQLQKGMEAPLMTELGLLVYAIDPLHGRELLPINQAIGLSLEKVGYAMEKSKQ
jgi:Fe-S-cluster containining protein